MTDSTIDNQDFVKNSSINGLILGGVGVLLTTLLYAIDYTLLVDWKNSILTLVLYCGVSLFLAFNQRKSFGGYLTYGKAFQMLFIMFAVAGLVSTLYSLLLYNVIDQELPNKLVEATIEKTRTMMEGFNVPDEAVEEAIEDMEESMPENFSTYGTLKGYGIFLLVSAIASSLLGLIVRKNEPLEL